MGVSAGRRPRLSVIVRTTGSRPLGLSEALHSLSSQSEPIHEVLLAVHSADPAALDAARAVASVGVQALAAKVSLLQVTAEGRAAPLNAGLEVATGDLVAFLDDDDVVDPDWASNFVAGAESAPGRVIRAWCRAVDVRSPRADEPGVFLVPVADEEARYCDPFDLLSHLGANATPICAWAVPRVAAAAAGLRFDEQLEVLEDWDFLMRAVLVLGIHDTARTTSLYRFWVDGSASLGLGPEVWAAARERVLSRLDEMPLPPGMARRVSDLVLEARASRAEVGALRVRAARADEMERSTIWRLTRPLRWVLDRLKRRGRRSDGEPKGSGFE